MVVGVFVVEAVEASPQAPIGTVVHVSGARKDVDAYVTEAIGATAGASIDAVVNAVEASSGRRSVGGLKSSWR